MSDIKFLHDSFDSELVLEDYGLGENPPKVIIVEDDHVFSSLLKKFIFRRFNLEAQVFNTPNSFIDYIDSESNVDKQSFCLISDISFDDNGMDGLLLLDILKEKDLKFFAILMTGFASVETAIAATKKGVFHYLTKPFELNSLGDLIQEAYKEKFQVDLTSWLNLNNINKISEKKINVGHKFKIEHPTSNDMFCGMIGRSKKMKNVFERINKVSSTDSTVLINGPSGTGKELVANAIHSLSLRKNASLVSINCGAIPEDLLESELFGHVKGAFTGAVLDRKGRFELANRGTIFLDEIGDMPLLLQVKLLRVLQSRTIDLVGGTSPKNIDVRIITASHRNLEHLVSEGNFREDLFYRLNVIPVIVPSLTERREDIPLLISYFLSRFISADGRNNVKFDNKVLDTLISYDWPGNVRELENLIERLVILRGGNIIRMQDLPAKIRQSVAINIKQDNLLDLPDNGIDLKKFLHEVEESLISQALIKTKGNKNQASKILCMNRTTLIEKMKKRGISSSILS